jgi:hypothetical protein
MSRPASRTRSLLVALFALPLAAAGAENNKPEFVSQTKDYTDQFQAAASDLQEMILAEKFGVVAVAEFTDLTGGDLHIGRIFAEELSTMLVATPIKQAPKKGGIGGLFGGGAQKFRVMDPSAIEEFVRAGGGASIWSSTKKIREFGKDSDVQIVVTGKIEISNREARFFLKAVETSESSIVWARTISVPGVAAGTETAAAPLAAAPVLDAQPLATEPATTADKPADGSAASAGVAAAGAAVGIFAGAGEAPPTAAPQAATAPVKPAAPSASPDAGTIPLAAVGVPTEVSSFENGWLRARIRSASKYEGSGWVTVVLDVTNLSDRPVFIDVAQDEPGRGVDEYGNAWRIERVSGLRLAPGANPGMTPLTVRAPITVVMILATTVQPSGKRLSFSPNLLWWGSNAAGDSGRVALAFANVRVD